MPGCVQQKRPPTAKSFKPPPPPTGDIVVAPMNADSGFTLALPCKKVSSRQPAGRYGSILRAAERFAPARATNTRQADGRALGIDLISAATPPRDSAGEYRGGIMWPFVGRQGELDGILRALDDPASRGFVVAGAAGVGKSRLIQEVAAQVDGARF